MNSYKVLSRQNFSFENFKIVPIRFIDRFEIMKWRNEQIYHLRQSKLLTEADQNAYFENVISNLFEQEKPSQILFSFLKDETCIGYGGLVHINWVDKNAEISFIMDTTLEEFSFVENWSVFLQLLQRAAFSNLGLHKIFTYAYDLRPRLYTALESQGFQKEARLKDHCYFQGKFIDVVLHSKINEFSLRKANQNDVDLTFGWASNENVRKYSFSNEKIIFDKHREWFLNKINDTNCQYFILNDSLKNSLGSIRVDRDGAFGIISYLIDPEYQGHGFGSVILILLENEIRKFDSRINYLVGYVIQENIASVRIFEKLNYYVEEEIDKLKFIKRIK